jgi:hypothetical protein
LVSIETAVQELVDREQIRELVYAYSHFADTANSEILDLFTEDCVFDLGPGAGGTIKGRDRLAAFLRGEYESPPGEIFGGRVIRRTSHHNPNVTITFQGADTAELVTSLAAWHLLDDGSEPVLWGYYDDVVVRTEQGWKFKNRVFRVYGDDGFSIEWNPGLRPAH